MDQSDAFSKLREQLRMNGKGSTPIKAKGPIVANYDIQNQQQHIAAQNGEPTPKLLNLQSKKIQKFKKMMSSFDGPSRNKSHSSQLSEQNRSTDYKKKKIEKKIFISKVRSASAGKSNSSTKEQTRNQTGQFLDTSGCRNLINRQQPMHVPKEKLEERFANQLILKFNILNFKKKNMLEDVKRVGHIGSRFHSYLDHIENNVEIMKHQLPRSFGSSIESVNQFLESQDPQLFVFQQIFQ